MTDDTKKPEGDYAVGYGKPPEHSRFKKGQSGNPKGRPKSSGIVKIDLEALLATPVTITRQGRAHEMQALEAHYRHHLAEAAKGKFRSLKYLIEQFLEYGAVGPSVARQVGGVIRIPWDMRGEPGAIAFDLFGPPPWTARQKATARAVHDQRAVKQQASRGGGN